ncbi:MAG: hypothetical protein AAGP08_03220 [Pseudomonadota bacterium]
MSVKEIVCWIDSGFISTDSVKRLKDGPDLEVMWQKSLEILDGQSWDDPIGYEYENPGADEGPIALSAERAAEIFENINATDITVLGKIDGEWWVASGFKTGEGVSPTGEHFKAFYLTDGQSATSAGADDTFAYLDSLGQPFMPCVVMQGGGDAGQTGSGWLADLGG